MQRKAPKLLRLERVSEPLPLYERLAEVIASKIASGEIAAGDRLPGEKDLAAGLGTSRVSVREALKILSALGVVAIKHGDGVYVTGRGAAEVTRPIRPLGMLTLEQLDELYEVRKVLECHAAAWASLRATTVDLRKLRGFLAEMRRIIGAALPGGGLDARSLDDLQNVHIAFHRYVVEMTGNPTLTHLLNAITDIIRESRKYNLAIPGRPLQSMYDHQKIYDGIRRGSPAAAAGAMFAHLDGLHRAIRSRLSGGRDEVRGQEVSVVVIGEDGGLRARRGVRKNEGPGFEGTRGVGDGQPGCVRGRK